MPSSRSDSQTWPIECPFPGLRRAWPMIHGYRIVRRLGSGGFGIVFLANDPNGGQCAIKLLKPRLDALASDRLLREARVSALLRHPRLVPCIDAGIELGHPFLIIEYVPGGDILTLRRRHARGLPREVLLGIASDAAEGLGALHDAGLCHRDVKPANLLLDADGRVRLADFGLTVAEDGHGDLATTTAGTICYMAPEQLRGGAVNRQCDLYALGATLFHLVTGRAPFWEQSTRLIAEAVVEDAFPDPQQAAPWIDDDVAMVLRRLTQKDPTRRYGSAGEVCDDLERLRRRSQPIHAVMADPALSLAATGERLRWTAHVYHDGSAMAGLPEALAANHLPEVRPVEIRNLPDACTAQHPDMLLYDAGRWCDAVATWASWLHKHAASARTVVIASHIPPEDEVRLVDAIGCTVIDSAGQMPAEIADRVTAVLSTDGGSGSRAGVPGIPAVTDMALTRTVVLAGRLDSANPEDCARYAKACLGLAGQLDGDAREYPRTLALAMARFVRDPAMQSREEVRRLLGRAARVLERYHRGCNIRLAELDALIVDDQPVGCLAIATVLRRNGLTCRTTHDAGSALSMAMQRRPHLLISDVCMPDKNGFELAEALQAQADAEQPPFPVLFVTAMGGLSGFFGSSRHACDIMAKPLANHELLLRALLLIGEARAAHKAA